MHSTPRVISGNQHCHLLEWFIFHQCTYSQGNGASLPGFYQPLRWQGFGFLKDGNKSVFLSSAVHSEYCWWKSYFFPLPFPLLNAWFPVKNDWDNWKYKLLSKYIFIENKRIFIFILLPASCAEEIIQREILLTQHFWHISLCASYLLVSEVVSDSEASPSWQVACSESSQLVNWR